jgi:hypothetical protein
VYVSILIPEQRLPKNEAKIIQFLSLIHKMVDVVTSIRISCPKSEVAEYTMNPDNAPLWYVNIKSVEWKTPRPLAIGSQIAFKARFLGKDLAYTYEITEYVSAEKLVMKTAQGPFPMETTYTFGSIDERTTLVTLRNRGNPTGFSSLFAPFMALMMRKTNEKDLIKLQSILQGKL